MKMPLEISKKILSSSFLLCLNKLLIKPKITFLPAGTNALVFLEISDCLLTAGWDEEKSRSIFVAKIRKKQLGCNSAATAAAWETFKLRVHRLPDLRFLKHLWSMAGHVGAWDWWETYACHIRHVRCGLPIINDSNSDSKIHTSKSLRCYFGILNTILDLHACRILQIQCRPA